MELQNVIIQKKNKRFGLGFHIGFGLNNQSISPNISIGINYNLINF